MIDFNIIIPARISSTRLHEKLLKKISNKTIIEHTYLAAKKTKAKRIVIATDDKKIIDVANGFGAEAILTSKYHDSGTERLSECVNILDFNNDDIIVNLQGDEPFMSAELINLCAKSLYSDSVSPVATLAAKINDMNDIINPNIVKVIVNRNMHAIYFSRSVIPFNRDNLDIDISENYLQHLGIYSYRAGFLKDYNNLPKNNLEAIEKLEQLRILYSGEKILVSIVNNIMHKGIDTEDDLIKAIEFFKQK